MTDQPFFMHFCSAVCGSVSGNDSEVCFLDRSPKIAEIFDLKLIVYGLAVVFVLFPAAPIVYDRIDNK